MTPLRLYVQMPPDALHGATTDFRIVIESEDGKLSAQSATQFQSPEARK